MDEMQALQAELDHYRTEKQKIRDIVGQVGGRNVRWWHRLINVVFLVLVIGAFTFDVLRYALDWKVSMLPPLLLLEVAVLLVSLKIIWMIHTQTKVDHFQFWILNSIEFQINILSRRVADLANGMKANDRSPAGVGGANETTPAAADPGNDARDPCDTGDADPPTDPK